MESQYLQKLEDENRLLMLSLASYQLQVEALSESLRVTTENLNLAKIHLRNCFKEIKHHEKHIRELGGTVTYGNIMSEEYIKQLERETNCL